MSDGVVLTLRARARRALDLSGVTPDRCADLLDERDRGAARLGGRHQGRVGDVFDVRGERAARIEVEGDLRDVTAWARARAAASVVDGDAGREAAPG